MLSLYIWIATQIITESLPISSSSHLKLIEAITRSSNSSYFLSIMPRYFDDLLHGSTLMVLAVFFFKRWSFLLFNFMRCIHIIRGIILRTTISASITIIFYFIFNSCIDATVFPVFIGLIISAFLLYSSRYCIQDKYEKMNYSKAAVLGIVQGLALLPGISRLASTYVVARWLNLSPRHALENSFVIQAPLIGAALIRALYFVLSDSHMTEFLNLYTWSVMLFSSIVAYGSLWIVWYCAINNWLWLFAYYLIIPIFLTLMLGL